MIVTSSTTSTLSPRRLFLSLLALLSVVASFVPLQNRRQVHTRAFMVPPDGEKHRRHVEFLNLEPLADTDQRRERKQRDSLLEEKFASYGDDLWELRERVEELSSELAEAMNEGSPGGDAIRNSLYELEQRDPEIVYKTELEAMLQAQQEGRLEDGEKHREAAMEARSRLPQFNLEGLWVGKYGDHGYEMINITYAGDVMVAYKVTGDKNVPRGEITFQADLSPLSHTSVREQRMLQPQEPLQPIALTPKAAKKWGTKQLPRFNGVGQVAEEGFTNNQWMDGQLILIGKEYFSFAWVPIEHQIFFGRPSPELALKMLRDGGETSLAKANWVESPPAMDDELDVLKQYATHCLEVTTEVIEEELHGDQFACIWHGAMDTEECFQ